MVVTAVLTYAILMFDRRGFRPMEIIIGALVGVIALSRSIDCSSVRTSAMEGFRFQKQERLPRRPCESRDPVFG